MQRPHIGWNRAAASAVRNPDRTKFLSTTVRFGVAKVQRWDWWALIRPLPVPMLRAAGLHSHMISIRYFGGRTAVGHSGMAASTVRGRLRLISVKRNTLHDQQRRSSSSSSAQLFGYCTRDRVMRAEKRILCL